MKTNAEMLRTIIEYAVKQGWQNLYEPVDFTKTVFTEDGIRLNGDYDLWYDLNTILFSHPFAKAVFGDEIVFGGYANGRAFEDEAVRVRKIYVPGWQYHLQQAVISDNPILYYYNFVTERREG